MREVFRGRSWHCDSCRQTVVQESPHILATYRPLDPAFWQAVRREAERGRLALEAARRERESGKQRPVELKKARRERTDGFFAETGG